MAENETITKLRRAVSNLVTLEIMTAVGKIRFKPQAGASPATTEESWPDLDYEENPKVILSKINLIQGDIKTVFDPEFVTGNYADLRSFHENREKEGHAIIQKNIEAIRSLIDLISEKFSEGS